MLLPEYSYRPTPALGTAVAIGDQSLEGPLHCRERKERKEERKEGEQEKRRKMKGWERGEGREERY